jgi:hypothetical protein
LFESDDAELLTEEEDDCERLEPSDWLEPSEWSLDEPELDS